MWPNLGKKSEFCGQIQWPPIFHIKFRNTDPPPPYLGIILKIKQFFLLLPYKSMRKKVFFGPTYYRGLTQKHCLNSVTPSYKKCPASPSGQFPTLPLSFPTQPYDCSDRLSKQSQCRQRRTQGQFLPHPLGIRCPPSQARGSSL